jgi:hypothetical protein
LLKNNHWIHFICDFDVDVGGGANEQQVTEAFKILTSDPRVREKHILVFSLSSLFSLTHSLIHSFTHSLTLSLSSSLIGGMFSSSLN